MAQTLPQLILSYTLNSYQIQSLTHHGTNPYTCRHIHPYAPPYSILSPLQTPLILQIHHPSSSHPFPLLLPPPSYPFFLRHLMSLSCPHALHLYPMSHQMLRELILLFAQLRVELQQLAGN
ncbi:hypothetical protein PVK06_037111 [Gossypium arboreum]|uniref:Uncharacterized protein n=1 Tax=Gossypium arboreum TaxID=29729 RepID=A0ABR0MWD1_GOSAR|nr:hypothetical protein PVK06_037111 [Gossypium arboreum]